MTAGLQGITQVTGPLRAAGSWGAGNGTGTSGRPGIGGASHRGARGPAGPAGQRGGRHGPRPAPRDARRTARAPDGRATQARDGPVRRRRRLHRAVPGARPRGHRTIINAYFRRWHEQIAAHGGVVEKFIGDAVMAVFGLHQSHEDDPHRAIRSALAMRSALDGAQRGARTRAVPPSRCGSGSTPARCVVSSLDDRPGQDFVVVGDTVNRAARIQTAAAPGGILISRDTHRHVRGWFSFTEVEPLQLKGITEPVGAYLVGSERPASFRLDDGPRRRGRGDTDDRPRDPAAPAGEPVPGRRRRAPLAGGHGHRRRGRRQEPPAAGARSLAGRDRPGALLVPGSRGADLTERRQRAAPRRSRRQARHPRAGRAGDGPAQAGGRVRLRARGGRRRPTTRPTWSGSGWDST